MTITLIALKAVEAALFPELYLKTNNMFDLEDGDRFSVIGALSRRVLSSPLGKVQY